MSKPTTLEVVISSNCSIKSRSLEAGKTYTVSQREAGELIAAGKVRRVLASKEQTPEREKPVEQAVSKKPAKTEKAI